MSVDVTDQLPVVAEPADDSRVDICAQFDPTRFAVRQYGNRIHCRRTERLLRHVDRLTRDRHYRDNQRQFFIQGARAFIAACTHSAVIDAIVVSSGLLKCSTARKLWRHHASANTKVVEISPEQFRQTIAAFRASGIAAAVRQRCLPLDDMQPSDNRPWLAVSRVRSTSNFGTLLRSAVAAGTQGLVLIGQSTDPYDPQVIRSSMGANFGLRIAKASWDSFRHWARTHGLTVIGARPNASQVLWDADLHARTVIMLGEERKGMSTRQRKACRQLVRIPMSASADSLNVGVAGSLLPFECKHQ